MPAHLKLSEEQVKQIRRRVGAGEYLSKLAVEYRVNRKTLRRRLDALELAEAEREARIAAKRLRRQAERERRTLRERERAAASASTRSDPGVRSGERGRARRLSPYAQWLETPKNLSGRALAEARGLVRVQNPQGTVCGWRERAEVDALLEAGWLLA